MRDIQNDELDQIFGGVTLSGRPKKQIDDDYKLSPVPYTRDAASALAAVVSTSGKTEGVKATAPSQASTDPSSSVRHEGMHQSRLPRYRFNLFMNSAK